MSIVALVASCSQQENKEDAQAESTSEATVSEKKEPIYFTAYDVLTSYNRDPKFLDRLKGRTVFINNIAPVFGDLAFTYGIGFNETSVTTPGRMMINGTQLNYENSLNGYEFVFHLINATSEDEFKLGDRESIDVDGVKVNVLRKTINIEINGDSIVPYSNSKIELRGAKIIKQTDY